LIESIRAKNFQSLKDVDLELGKLTVIVGASSSGKSALTRAMKAVTSNALDSDNITKGSKSSSVSLRTGEATVTIERSGGSSVYKVAKDGSQEQVFTKLNRSVPAEVTEALGIQPSTQEVASINFAGQFDTPYLLKEGASSVARVLGELTNVSTIFSAVREASKRAKNASALVNLRKKDRDKLIAQISEYAGVAKQAELVTSAEETLAECIKLQSQISLLRDLLDRATMASQALSAVKEFPTPPDLAGVLEAQEKLNTFKDTLRQVALARQTIATQDTSISDAQSAILQAEQELHDTLVAAGKCPTCNQEINA
jgi:DNA repair exonuclease SbcCD ATPase subunit